MFITLKGGEIELYATIKLDLQTEITALAKIAEEAEVNVLLRHGVHVVDATSLLGIFSLDLSQPITIDYPGSDEERLEFYKKLESKGLKITIYGET